MVRISGTYVLQQPITYPLGLPDIRSYIPPVKIGEVMRGSVIGQVVASRSSAFPTGSHATANVGWTELAVVPEQQLEKIEVPKNGKVTDALGAVGEATTPKSPSLSDP